MCRVFLVCATIPKYQRQKLDALVNVALNYRLEDKHKGKITFTGGKHDTGTLYFYLGNVFFFLFHLRVSNREKHCN